MAKSMNRKRWVILVLLIISVVFSLRNPKNEKEGKDFSVFLQRNDGTNAVSLDDRGLEYDFYGKKCPQAEAIVRSTMAQIYSQHKDVTAGLLRLFFHDCFIKVHSYFFFFS